MVESNAQQPAPFSLPPQALLLQMGLGALVGQALGVAAELSIADHLNDGPRSISDLADTLGVHERSVYRVMRSLASVGIFTEVGERTFANTPLSETMRSDVPGSMRGTLRFMARPWHYQVWGNMLEAVVTGETAWNRTYDEKLFEWFGEHSEEGEIFNQAMTEISAMAAPVVVAAYDFTGIDTLADIAGGHGLLLSQILRANPAMKGILFDMDHVIAGAGEMLEIKGVADRVQAVSGDFFVEVPAADAYIMKHIIHDWDDERAITILKSIHRAMNGDGHVLLVEMVVPEGDEPHPSKILDLEMLTLPGGTERTEKEYVQLVAAAGFKLNRIVPTQSAFSIIEAVKA
ncbi:MAG: methyltransferase [Blastocatellia bacterium]